jgi:hypothetical protein
MAGIGWLAKHKEDEHMRRAILVTAVVSISMASGCMTAVKQTYYGVTGAQGSFYELHVVDPDRLAEYRSVNVEPFGNDLGPHVPEEVITEVNLNTPKTIAEGALFYPEGKELKIQGRIIHYTGKSGLKGSIGSIIGGENVCVCRVQLLDGESGEMIGEGVCWGSVKSAVRRGASEYGAGVGKGVTKWLEERLPEAERKRRKEDLTPK